jgi:choline dehydrogenase-like flavoprotein
LWVASARLSGAIFEMIINAETLEKGTTLSFDVCIVGSGAAGLTIAHELQQSKLSVCVLEGGGFNGGWSSQKLYKGEVVGNVFPTPMDNYLVGSRLRYVGGSTNHWTGWCRPLDVIDFEKRDWVPHSGWPYDRSVLEPYYQRAAEITGIADVISNEGKHQPISPLLFGDSEAVLRSTVFHLSSRVLRSNDPALLFRERYGRSLASAERTSLITGANVTEIESNAGASYAERVKVLTATRKPFYVKAKAVVLACGGIENARLLLASNSTAKRGLGNEHDLVGRYFMEHPITEGAARVLYYETAPRLSAFMRYRDTAVGQDCVVALTIPESVQRAEKLPGINVELRIGDAKQPHNSLTKSLGTTTQALHGLARSQSVKSEEVIGNTLVMPMQVRIEQVPNPESRVVLSDQKDELGSPRVRLDWRVTEQDRALYKRALELLPIEFARTGIGRIQIVTEAFGEGGRTVGQYHHMGTTRMHDDPKQGVVDRNCRVHSVSNLYAAGSSVFTTGGHVGPTYTIVALAVKLADHLKEVIRA